MVNTDNLTSETISSLTFSEEERAALDRARKMKIVFDKDCPETTPERALKFRRVNPSRNQKGKMT